MTNQQQIALVTGASGGIGKAIAERLVANGYYVFAAARSMKKLEAMRTNNIEPLQLDVTDSDGVETAVSHIKSSKGRLDLLVNNAGYGIYGTVEGVSQADVRKAFDVNLFGLGLMTQAVLPLMRTQKSGTIINISSVVGKVAMPFTGWYAATKFAVEGLTDSLRNEVKQFGINVILIEPGSIDTGFEDVAMDTLEKSSDPSAYDTMRTAFANLIRNSYKNAPGPEAVTKVVMRALSSSRPKARYIVGTDARMMIFMKRLLSDGLFDRFIGTQF